MIGFQEHITFKEDTHQYFDPKGKEYKSVSNVLKSITPDFDREAISMAMAKRKAEEEGISITSAQGMILQEWDDKKDSAIDWGNWIHGNIEDFLNTGSCDAKLTVTAKKIASFVSNYYKFFTEALIYDSEYKVAGQTDLALQRQRGKTSVFDFFDFKTNEAKGIYFDSVKRENGKVKKHYNRFLKEPLDHLEDTNYNLYSLQLSLYAYMASRTFDLKVGRLGIIFIDQDLKIKVYPVPYMKNDVRLLLEQKKSKDNASWE